MSQLSIARELTAIEAQGKLRIGVKDNLRPLGYINQQGNLVGLEIDIAHKLGEELLGDGNAVELIAVTNEERLQMVLADQVDLAIARVAVTTSRTRIVDFSPHYYLDGTGIVTNQPQLTKIEQLANQKIAVLENSATIAIVRQRMPEAILVGVTSYQAALQLIEKQQVAAFAGDRSVLTGWVQEYPNYQLLPDRLSGSALAIVMPKGLQYQELRSQINQAIAKWQQSGWLQERIKYWGL